LPVTQYDQQRKDAAKRLGMRVGTLDDLVERLRPDRAAMPMTTSRARRSRSSRPSRGRTGRRRARRDMIDAHRKYVIMSEHGALAVALWEIHATRSMRQNTHPRLQIKSPTCRCGKPR
jgi:hypothetical protein